MEFISHTLEWYKGEVFEALISLGAGVALTLIAMIFWGLGSTPGAQAMVIPLVLIGLILAGSGTYGTYSNQRQITQYQQNPPLEIASFIQAEKERVEGFQSLYTFTKYLALGLFATAVCIFFFTQNRYWQAAAIAMVVLGLSGLVIDFFSKERADSYYEVILQQNH